MPKCPRCGYLNPNVATNCKRCQLDLAWARENLGKIKYLSSEEFGLLIQQERERAKAEREKLIKEQQERGPIEIQRTCSVCGKDTACDYWKKPWMMIGRGKNRVREFAVFICSACQQRYKRLRNLFILVPSALLTLLFAAQQPMQQHIEQIKAGFFEVWLLMFVVIFGIVAAVMAYLWFFWVANHWLYSKATRR